jgi:hypothetical protein
MEEAPAVNPQARSVGRKANRRGRPRIHAADKSTALRRMKGWAWEAEADSHLGALTVSALAFQLAGFRSR